MISRCPLEICLSLSMGVATAVRSWYSLEDAKSSDSFNEAVGALRKYHYAGAEVYHEEYW